jgi:hypothetical protein
MSGQKTNKSKQGGARPGAGRAKMPSGALAVRKSITIDPADEQTLMSLGGGLSMGIRLAAQIVRELKDKY